MVQKRLAIREIRDVLRLKYTQGRSHRAMLLREQRLPGPWPSPPRSNLAMSVIGEFALGGLPVANAPNGRRLNESAPCSPR